MKIIIQLLLTLNCGSDSRILSTSGANNVSVCRLFPTSTTFILIAPPEFSSASCKHTVKALARSSAYNNKKEYWFYKKLSSNNMLLNNNKFSA